MKKALILLIIVLGFALIISGCGNKATTSQGPITIKLAHVVAENHASHIALQQFKKDVEEKSAGKVKVEIYPNGQLGNDRQAIEAVSLGTLEMTMCVTSVAAGFDEKLTVLDLPFLFKSKEAAYKALDGEFGERLNKLLVAKNIVNLGFAEGGYRHITNNLRPITKPEDLKGIKIRTMENPLHIATFKAFGANPTPMAFGELFTALQQGTVDAQENPFNLVITSKFYEVQKYMSLTGHVYGSVGIFINKKYYDGLPADIQKIVKDAADNAKKLQRQLLTKQDDEAVTVLKTKMQINDLTSDQKQAFVNAAKSVYDDFAKKFGNEGKELIDLATR